MMCGYVKLPPEAAFDEDGFFHSGDSGWFDEAGLLHFTGRLSHIIKTSGANVSPLEVEERLMSHPELDEAAVVGIPDPILGEIVVACVVTAAGSSATEEKVQQFLRGSLASYKIPVACFSSPKASYLGLRVRSTTSPRYGLWRWRRSVPSRPVSLSRVPGTHPERAGDPMASLTISTAITRVTSVDLWRSGSCEDGSAEGTSLTTRTDPRR